MSQHGTDERNANRAAAMQTRAPFGTSRGHNSSAASREDKKETSKAGKQHTKQQYFLGQRGLATHSH